MAADNLISGKILIIKSGKLAKVLSKGTFSLPGGAPTITGGSLLVEDQGNPSNSDTYSLPAAGWKGLGNPPGSNGYKYKGAGTPTDPCKVVLIKTNIVKAVCKGSGVTVATPVAGAVATNLSAGGDSYCTEFGGTEVKNTTALVKRKDANAPTACASPSGAFLDGAALF